MAIEGGPLQTRACPCKETLHRPCDGLWLCLLSGNLLCREIDSWMFGAGCGLSVGNRRRLCGNGLLFCQYAEQLVNLTLLVGNGEAGLRHIESVSQSRKLSQLAHE